MMVVFVLVVWFLRLLVSVFSVWLLRVVMGMCMVVSVGLM